MEKSALPMTYKKLEIWKLARELSVDIHQMTLTLPRFEQFEEAQQIRKSSNSVRSAIVAGYARRRNTGDFMRYIVEALASNDETIDHLETLYETKSLTNDEIYETLQKRLVRLGKKLAEFLRDIEQSPYMTGENQTARSTILAGSANEETQPHINAFNGL